MEETLRYKFAKGYEDAEIHLATYRQPITKHNLTNKAAEKILKIPALAHNIVAIDAQQQKAYEEQTEGTEVDDLGNRVLSKELRKDTIDPNVPAELAAAKEGEVVGIQESPEDIYVDEPAIVKDAPVRREPLEIQSETESTKKTITQPVSPKGGKSSDTKRR